MFATKDLTRAALCRISKLQFRLKACPLRTSIPYNLSDVKAAAKPFVNRSGGKQTDSDPAVRTYLMKRTEVLANTLLIATGRKLSDSNKQ